MGTIDLNRGKHWFLFGYSRDFQLAGEDFYIFIPIIHFCSLKTAKKHYIRMRLKAEIHQDTISVPAYRGVVSWVRLGQLRIDMEECLLPKHYMTPLGKDVFRWEGYKEVRVDKFYYIKEHLND